MIKCQICQHENPDGAEYCEDCGASLVPSTAPQSIPVTTAPPAAEAVAATSSPPVEAALPADAAATGAPASTSGAVVDATPPSPPTPAAAPTPPAPPAPAAGGQPRLVAHRYGAATSDEYPLLGDHLVVGRFDAETGPVDIDLSGIPEAGHLSRHHAEIYREADGQWHVKDLGSTNGVFVKTAGSSTFGPRLTEPRPLANEDEVAFGNARFIFRAD